MDTITLTLNGVEYHDIIPKEARFDPETEDLIYADELQNGMIAVIESSERANESWSIPYIHEVHVKNRWCEVSKIRVSGDDVYFIGIYADGLKVVRWARPHRGWIIKKVENGHH